MATRLRKLLGSRQAYDDDAVRALVETDPGAARCGCGFRVLYRALECGASARTVQAICEAHPGAVREKEYGDTALHKASHYCTPLDVIRLLLERWPEAIGEKDYYGRTPLHMACGAKDGPSLEVIQFLANQHPKSLAEKDDCGSTPLAVACAKRSESDELLFYLIEKYPDAVKESDSRKWFPLHMACYWGASSRVVTLLADRFPKCLESKEANGNTPLHLACGKYVPVPEIIKLLVKRYPKALAIQNKSGRTPLHLACLSNGNIEVLQLLIEQCPTALAMQDNSGCTPLHSACLKNRHLEVLQLLIERRPEALETLDGEGHTPLQCANEARHPDAVKLLTTLQSLANLTDNDPQVLHIIRHFQDMRWPGGMALVINAFPSVANKLDQALMPTVLSLVGRRCTLNTFYRMLQDNPMLVKAAVKKGNRSEKPSAKKKARTEYM